MRSASNYPSSWRYRLSTLPKRNQTSDEVKRYEQSRDRVRELFKELSNNKCGIAMNQFCQIEYARSDSDVGTPCSNLAVAECADCGAAICADCRTYCCGQSFCEVCGDYH
jgi:hypothetical protein